MGTPSAAIAQTGHRVAHLSIEPPLVPAEDPRAGKLLVFRLATEDFAIRVTSVQEILGMMEITSVPQTAAYVKGVINLRGRVIPVIDLRLRLGFPSQSYTSQTCIVVVRTRFDGNDRFTGIIVDEVSEVVSILADDIQDTPDFGISTPSPHLLGMARANGKVRILLDIEQVLKSHDTAVEQP